MTKRILLYGINFAPELTGIGKYTGELAAWLAERGHQVPEDRRDAVLDVLAPDADRVPAGAPRRRGMQRSGKVQYSSRVPPLSNGDASF